MPNMVEARCGHTSVTVRNKLYVIGGLSIQRMTRLQCEVFDCYSRVFIRILPQLSLTRYYYSKGMRCVALGNKIVVYYETWMEYRTYVFDVEKGNWSDTKQYGCTRPMLAVSCLKVPKIQL